jgi:hypothetical protein
MNRIEFIKKASKYFNTTLDPKVFDGLMHYTVSGKQAETLYDLSMSENKKTRNKEKEKYLLSISKIHNFLESIDMSITIEELNENVYIKSNIDHYALEDHDKLLFDINFNINQVYDLLKIEALENKLIDIYRVEDIEGQGVYKSNLRIYSEDTKLTPAPEFDDNVQLLFTLKRSVMENYAHGYRKKWYFGFEKKDDILNWFYDEKDSEDFIRKNINVVHYKVPEKFMVKSDTQVVFKRENAIKIKSLSFKEHLNSNSITKLLESKLNNKSKEKNKIKI